MEYDGTIVQYIGTYAMRYRLFNLFTSINQRIYDITDEMQLYRTLTELSHQSLLIIVDVDGYKDEGAEILKKIREKDRYSPVIVISSITKRSFYVESILRGATDFILKPFDDDLVLLKVLDHFKIKEDKNLEIISFDLSTYLKGEIRKAEKGQYALSLMFFTYYFEGSDVTSKIGKQNTYSLVYDAIKLLFWDTDIFIRFGTNYYIGVFPFCDEANTRIISQKISEKFFELQSEHVELSKFKMLTIFNTFSGAKSPDEMLQSLIEKVRQRLPNEDISPIN